MSDMIPIEQYAAAQRVSIYSVIQKINRGELQEHIETVEGVKKRFILQAQPQQHDYKAAYEALQKELEALKAKQQ
ncbi:MAG: hypothetical protein JXK05_05325 [Campylobacterales bacterium]|nr:hypothetical protein [Campylobacterales bacterium]